MRLDLYLYQNGYCKSRQNAQNFIKNGAVSLDGKTDLKPSTDVCDNNRIEILFNPLKYVGRGGLKLEKALKEFNIQPKNMVCADIGASTGGFTDCLL
ncbi:MAG: TlyA family RNA methyltransferase, partial [Oscillospiraceae bacterium]|nr:TlyA family RNA methyltransferase [Candidatus Equicaccousia limihippi]